MPKERNVSEEDRLDRIERHILLLTQTSAALHAELQIARQLAATRKRALQLHDSAKSKQAQKKRRSRKK
jgi:hypothetical protein